MSKRSGTQPLAAFPARGLAAPLLGVPRLQGTGARYKPILGLKRGESSESSSESRELSRPLPHRESPGERRAPSTRGLAPGSSSVSTARKTRTSDREAFK